MLTATFDVLLVDDDRDLLRALARSLRRFGISVQVASAASAALEALRQHLPNTIVCDYDLESDNGAEVLEIVARTHPRVRRVLYSGYAARSFGELITRGVAHAILTKPAALKDLLAAVRPDSGTRTRDVP